mgnify:CR=1 FL=1
MGRPKGSRNNLAGAAGRILSDLDFAARMRLTEVQLKTLDALADGGWRPRNAATVLAALRLKAEFGHVRPEVRSTVSGTVAITVVSALPGAPGSLAPSTVPRQIGPGPAPDSRAPDSMGDAP